MSTDDRAFNGVGPEAIRAAMGSAQDYQPPAQAGCITRCVADIPAVPISFLWEGRLARGKVNLLAGHPGLGKSQLTAYMAALVSTGGTWPDGAPCPLGNVLILSAEDDVADTIRPRLEAAGADIKRVHVIDGVRTPTETGHIEQHPFDLEFDIENLRNTAIEVGDVKLVVIDPVSAYLGTIDSHVNAQVRGVLAELTAFAAEIRATVLLVTHLNKASGDSSALSRITGSGAFGAACRSAWLVGDDPEDDDRNRRILTPLKNNLGDDKTGFAYRTEGVKLSDSITSSRICFEPGTVATTASELLRGRRGTPDLQGALWEAMDFLREQLADGPKPAKQIMEEAEAEGIYKRTLDRAKKELGAKSKRNAMTGKWDWLLPDGRQAEGQQLLLIGCQERQECQPSDDGQPGNLDQKEDGGCQGCPPSDLGTLGNLGTLPLQSPKPAPAKWDGQDRSIRRAIWPNRPPPLL